ncbi:unnamed protein product, partial [marine sediment metagenome]
ITLFFVDMGDELKVFKRRQFLHLEPTRGSDGKLQKEDKKD